MSNPYGIIVFGANGSGKTTLGRELAYILGYKHMDIEDYHFEKSDVPYTVVRPRDDCLRLLLDDITKHNSFVLSAVTGDFGDDISQYYELAVYISAPKDLRMSRIEAREAEQHGERIFKGGDMHESHLRFTNFVASRPLVFIDEWAKTLICPVIHVDGTIDYHINAVRIAEQIMKVQKG